MFILIHLVNDLKVVKVINKVVECGKMWGKFVSLHQNNLLLNIDEFNRYI